jgi:hypothetical protein
MLRQVQPLPMIIVLDSDDPGCADVMVDGSIAGHPFRFLLDTGAARTQIVADEVTAGLNVSSQESSAGVFGGTTTTVVTVRDLVVGPLAEPTLDVVRIEAGGPGARNLLGMDVLRRHCCHFRFDSGSLLLADSPAAHASRALQMDDRGHSYVEVSWPGVTGQAVWDSGAGITVVDQAFLDSHPDLFEECGSSVGTDAHGAQRQTPMFGMAGPLIGGAQFAGHKVAVVDLAPVNATLDIPMDLILGFPTLRQANWLLDFPAGRWEITSRPVPGGSVPGDPAAW